MESGELTGSGAADPRVVAPAGVIETALRREGMARRFASGQSLFVEGDGSGRVFLIEHGWVVLTRTAPNGRDVVLAVRGARDVVGELSSLDGQPRIATATAIGIVDAIVAPSRALTLALADPAGAHELIAILAAQLRDADGRLLEYAALDTIGRVAGRLLELAARFGTPTDHGIVIELALSQEQLASWCGASREATVKALAALRRVGCLQTARRSIQILDLTALRRHARGLA